MLGPDGLHVADGGQVEFGVPLDQFLLVVDERHHLPRREVDVEKGLCVLNEGVHVWHDYTQRGGDFVPTMAYDSCQMRPASPINSDIAHMPDNIRRLPTRIGMSIVASNAVAKKALPDDGRYQTVWSSRIA